MGGILTSMYARCFNCTCRVSAGKALDLPVYFGDAGSPAVLHSVGAERAACAVITLDTAGANYRSVWAMQKHYPSVKTFVRAHDINHGLNLEKAGATVVVPEILEPSMQLAASVLSQFNLPPEEINTHLNNFRKKHLSELQALAALSGEAQRRDFCVCYKTSRDVCSRCTGWLATWVSCIC
jgi:voltage-gated potassium channel Kch